MLQITNDHAQATLREALDTMPADADARSNFFVQWRARTAGALDLLFADDPAPSQQFKEIEFSPRRLTKDDARDEQLRLDAYLSGCAAARTFLEELMRRIADGAAAGTSADAAAPAAASPPPATASPPPATAAQPAATMAPPAATVSPPATPAPVEVPPMPAALAPAASVVMPASQPPAPELPRAVVHTPEVQAAVPVAVQSESIRKGADMEAVESCGPVRNSLSRVLGAWDRGDRDTASMVSAQLLAELTLLAHHDRFKAAFASVVERSFPTKSAPAELDALKAAAPLCVWSVFAAMNEVMKSDVPRAA